MRRAYNSRCRSRYATAYHYSILQYTTPYHYSTPLHTTVHHCIPLQYTTAYYSTSLHTTTVHHCILQYTSVHCMICWGLNNGYIVLRGVLESSIHEGHTEGNLQFLECSWVHNKFLADFATKLLKTEILVQFHWLQLLMIKYKPSYLCHSTWVQSLRTLSWGEMVWWTKLNFLGLAHTLATV